MNDVRDRYRMLADKARSDAAAASLPNVRQLHLNSADRLEKIIAGFESVAQAKRRNEEARRNEQGNTPLAYQPALRDPIGRTVEVEFRSTF